MKQKVTLIPHNAQGDSHGVFAGLVALITHPVVIGTLGLILIIRSSIPTLSEQLFYLITLVTITFAPAALYMLVHFRGNVAEMLEMVEREARLIPYLLMILGAVGAIVLLTQLNAPQPVFIMTLVLLANEVVMGTINFWTKVSIHTATVTFTAITLGALVHPNWYALLFLVPLIAWARIYRKRHTLQQVTSGAVLSGLLTSIVIFLSSIFIQ
jgi:membrane-associated phospholipid phosphatase